MSSNADNATVPDIVDGSELVDLTSMSLRDLLFDGETPLDRAARAMVAGMADEIYSAFNNAPRA